LKEENSYGSSCWKGWETGRGNRNFAGVYNVDTENESAVGENNA
jgi:hypothetical protein